MSGSASAAAGQSGRVSSAECCLPLLLPLGARAISLGQSLTTRAGVDGLFFNPASLARINKDEVLFHHQTTFEGADNTITVAVDAGLAGSFGLSWVLLDKGETESTSASGDVTGTLASRFQQLVASYATPVTSGLRAGLNIKVYNEARECVGYCQGLDGSATTYLVDLGMQFRPPFLQALELGAAVTQFGFALQENNAEQADQTPARLRAGAAYEFMHHFRADSAVTAWLSLDVVNRLRAPTTPVAGVGLEVSFDRAIFVRGGYSGSGDALTPGGGGLGVGIRYSRFTVDVAKLFQRSEFDSGGESFLVSFGITF